MNSTDAEPLELSMFMKRESLTEMKNHPNHWFNRSSDLHASAGAVWHSMGAQSKKIAQELELSSDFDMGLACYHVYHMLCGLALEVMVKAVLMHRQVDESQLKTHSFEKLHLLLGISLKGEELRLLKFYEGALVWAGRYPTPIKANDDKLMEFYSLANSVLTKDGPPLEGTTLRLTVASGATDWPQYQKLWAKYARMFDELDARGITDT